MFKVKVENTKSGRTFIATFNTQEMADDWVIKQIEKQSWGKGERWVVDKNYNGDLPYPVPSEAYDEADVLDREDRQVGNPDDFLVAPFVKLKPEYEYQIIDLSNDAQWIKEKRIKERINRGQKKIEIKNKVLSYLVDQGHDSIAERIQGKPIQEGKSILVAEYQLGNITQEQKEDIMEILK